MTSPLSLPINEIAALAQKAFPGAHEMGSTVLKQVSLDNVNPINLAQVSNQNSIFTQMIDADTAAGIKAGLGLDVNVPGSEIGNADNIATFEGFDNGLEGAQDGNEAGAFFDLHNLSEEMGNMFGGIVDSLSNSGMEAMQEVAEGAAVNADPIFAAAHQAAQEMQLA